MYLYHYYDKSTAPFLNLSDLSPTEAEAVMCSIRKNKPDTQAAKRQPSYIKDRLYYEEILTIIDKYGLPQDWNNDGKYLLLFFNRAANSFTALLLIGKSLISTLRL